MDFEERKKARSASLKGLKAAMDERMASRMKKPESETGLQQMAEEAEPAHMENSSGDDMEGLDPRLVIIIEQKRKMQKPFSLGAARG